ncbi:hypothetical protein KLP40_01800 [Hymenobacter sp. NST-14]|uniref:hypothetical protein n=1 Tax=Hymenobacter piscis TaxID=2839984 RepID=UPI001C02DE1C|nr:hypothetical protein [Hymenobacter piscis]MBT9391883.1 hypothetical protein [Hymenobacter piscis]
MEAYFQVAIPDGLAETIGTVGDMAAAVALLRGLPTDTNRTAVHAGLLARVIDCLRPQFQAVAATTPLRELGLLRRNGPVRAQLAACLKLPLPPVPAMPATAPGGWLQRLFSPRYPTPSQPDWPRATLADFTDWLLAHNYRQLLPRPATLYEVQQAVIGLTADKCGISEPEIKLTDSFTTDLGID